MKKGILIVAVIILSLVIITIVNRSSYDKKIVKYVKDLGYTEDNVGVLYKQVSEHDLDYFYEHADEENTEFYGLYFSPYSYEYTVLNYTSIDKSKLRFSATYSYKEDTLTFGYQLQYENDTAIYVGNYNLNTEEFNCTGDYNYNTNINQVDADICVVAKGELDKFVSDIKTFINNSTFLEYMKKKD